MEISLDTNALKEFEESLDPAREKAKGFSFRILGYGEISTVIEVEHPGLKGIALKRIPGFESRASAEKHAMLYKEYNEILRSLGISTPRYGWAIIERKDRVIVLYLAQELLSENKIGNKLIHVIDEEGNRRLFEEVVRKLALVWRHNLTGGEPKLGIDGQISNWALRGESIEEGLYYLDTSTPLMRRSGVEQINPKVFLRSAPPGIRLLLEKAFLQEILDRYYDPHSILVDLIANYIKEKKRELIPKLVEWANTLLSDELRDLGIKPITLEEVVEYYKRDAMIWSIYLSARKLHRAIVSKLLRRRYEYILPDKIERW